MNHPYIGQNNSNSLYTPQQSNRYQQINKYEQTNRYANNGYIQSNKVTQSILNQPSPTGQQKLYLQRNQSFQNRQYNQQLIQLIAKIRSLQDDLLNQRFKNQSLQRKLSEQQRIIDNLQYQLNRQSYQLQKYVHEIQLSNQKNIQILKYEQNLKIVGEQIQQLNDILTKRNNQCDQLSMENKQLINQINKIIQQTNLVNVRFNIWMKEIQNLLEEHKQYMIQRNLIASPNNNQLTKNINMNNNMNNNFNNSMNNTTAKLGNINNNTNQMLNTPSPSRNKNINFSPNNNNINYSPNNNNIKYQSSFRQYAMNQSVTFDMSNSYIQMSKKIQLIRTLCSAFSQQIQQINSNYQSQRKLTVQRLMVQKQKYIKLQYEHKLLQQRLKDNQKKKDIISFHYNQQKYQNQLNQMLNKQDQYILTIQQLTQQNQQLKQQLSTLQQNHQYIQEVNTKQKQSMIKSKQRENKLLQQTINQLTIQLNQLRSRLNKTQQQYQTLINQKQNYTIEQNEQTMKLNKKIRKLQQENYQHQIHIEQLNGQINLLQKQLQLIYSQQQ